jgi:hypothetical protein
MTEHHDDPETYDDFRHAVNMTRAELSRWLDSDDSKAVGQKQGDLGADDYAHMRKVVGYVKRHLAQRPDGDVTDTPWRYSLMNWGHDPTKSPLRHVLGGWSLVRWSSQPSPVRMMA